MKAILNQVIEILEQSEGLYQNLLPIINREKQAALGSDPRQLAAVTVEKEELLARMGRLERQRIKLIDQLADDLNVSPAQLSLSALAARTDTYQAYRILSLRDSMGELVKKIKRANEENRLLIQHCLDLARGALGFFQHWMTPVSVYGSSGRMDNDHRSGKLLSGTI
jgi:flagellar biosynthesis/type III secretory pathway chaperone